MSDLKARVQSIDPNVKARDIRSLAGQTGNIYESLAVISNRARQISSEMREELHSKLEEFAITTEAIEEFHENKEQIEISKFYERLPNPVVIATEEFINGELEYRFKENQ
ncbi:MAG TPA: DNA-directed RNA polymerase subunit omega [Saprospiraceae bacterium]|nr:DNA-directed RNA polymerase subunit omega [Saprospiraceae bacterium]MCB9327591.1 DNA-directed RNA polymerase subunit omega [Lewinellaceae bacterium]HPK09719.1 DNA-directed RNA polymerase subunit omega [Saprospiraceae bacterium]HPQ21554.1 DNA-directed RNA polymerase subunit omega [Saprospiraceae bacterium]HRX27801.1 DNA-directed RNA polymerase subunit omega [Saprospiraceae bacterium]